MKKIWKLIIGGIETKIFNLILLTVILLAGAFAIVTASQSRMLAAVKRMVQTTSLQKIFPPFGRIVAKADPNSRYMAASPNSFGANGIRASGIRTSYTIQ